MFQPSPETEVYSSSNNHFLKIKDKESITGIFRGKPFYFWQKWPKGEKPIKVPLDDKNPTSPGPGFNFRFQINLVTLENGAWVAKIWDQGKIINTQIFDLQTAYKDISERPMIIKRSGSNMNDTTYSILPMFEPLSQEQLTQIKNVKLHDLKIWEENENPF